MSNVLPKAVLLQSAALAFAKGDTLGAVELLDEILADPTIDLQMRRRALSASGGCLVELGQWRMASDRLVEAKRIADEMGDVQGSLAVLVNQSSLHLHTWEYGAVIDLTNDIEMSDSPDDTSANNERATLLANRASSALELREFDIADHAARRSFEWLKAERNAGRTCNTIHLANAGLSIVRIALHSSDFERAKSVISFLEQQSLKDRALVTLMLAHGTLAGATNEVDLARNLLKKIIATAIPEGLKRDALLLLLRIELTSGNVHEVFAVLKDIGDLVIGHRSSQLNDAISMQELAVPVLARVVAEANPSARSASIFGCISRIVEACDTGHGFKVRRAAAALAIEFGDSIGLGTRFVKAIARGIIMRDFGALSLRLDPSQSRALARESLRATLSIFDRARIDRTSPEYRVAAFRYEQCDGTGVLGVTVSDIPREAQVAALCVVSAQALVTHQSLPTIDTMTSVAGVDLCERMHAHLLTKAPDTWALNLVHSQIDNLENAD
ncbi:MAG: hypothetical protein EAZ21_14750 [Betaproteobacteria bacterium]|nr:MAG: hypothetical protein EAZ21_14750 [Betaproteobacteria bacterium]